MDIGTKTRVPFDLTSREVDDSFMETFLGMVRTFLEKTCEL